MTTVGQALITARKCLGIAQKDLAAQVRKEDGTPMSAPYLNDIEHGRRCPPAPHLLREFARVLGLSSDYLFFLAGRLPDDVRQETEATPQAVEAAFASFRRTLCAARVCPERLAVPADPLGAHNDWATVQARRAPAHDAPAQRY